MDQGCFEKGRMEIKPLAPEWLQKTQENERMEV